MKRSDQINELATALAKAQGQVKAAEKDAQNPHFRSDYATLASVWAACREALTSNGLSVVQSPELTEVGTVRVVTLLLHSSGQWIETELELTPKDASPQAVGSAITYGRRYGLMPIAGVAPADDDDGNGATGAPQDHKPARGPAQVQPLAAAKKESKPAEKPGEYVCKFGTKFKDIAIRDIAAADLRSYVKYLKDNAESQKKKLGGAVAEFVANADAYLGAKDPESFENFNEPGMTG